VPRGALLLPIRLDPWVAALHGWGAGFCPVRDPSLGGYDGFSVYVTAGIFLGHLKFCEEQPKGVVNLSRAPVLEDASQHQENGQGAPSPRIVKPSPPLAKLPARERESSKTRASGADGHSLKPVRSIAGLTLADFLYDR
jgi:hypothetical protein